MSEPAAPRAVPGGVRKYARYGPVHSLRRWWTTRGIGALGDEVYVESNVRILRHPERVFLGSRVMLKEGVRLCPTNPSARISVGDWTTVGYHVFVFAATSVEIGSNCLIAPFCYFVDNDHQLERARLIREQELLSEPIVVEDDVWLGANVVVTRGARIGRGAVIGAGSVVTRDVPAYSIAAGSPARVIRARE